MDFLGVPIGYMMDFINRLVCNYGLTIVIISILFKIILLPLTMKQQKSTQAMQAIQPKIAEIQKKYANEKERQSMEMMKLYKEYNVKPLAGCLPTLLQFPILIGLYGAIAKPLKFMFHMSGTQISSLCSLLGLNGGDYYVQIKAAQMAGNSEFISQAQAISSNIRAVDFNFLGLDLAGSPQLRYLTVFWILPILAGVLTYVSSRLMQGAQTPGQEGQKAMKVMNWLFPVMITWFGFQVPAGLSLYWVTNSVLQIVQFYTIDRKYKEKIALAVENNMIEEKIEKARRKKKK